MDVLITTSVAALIIYVIVKSRFIGTAGWIIFGLAWIQRFPYYFGIGDYFNSVLVILAFIFFSLLGITIFLERTDKVLLDITKFSVLSALVYFPFAYNQYLNENIIRIVAENTIILGNLVGFPMGRVEDVIFLNGKKVQIILACTGIESMALFVGATLGIRAENSKKFKAFIISVPVIYFLNLWRNVFVTSAFGYQWFGEESFYIAHHIISKVLSTLALVAISLAVFKVLPELADLIYDLKELMVKRWRP